MVRQLLRFALASMLIVMLASCGEDDPPTNSSNTAPSAPAIDSTAGGPANGATGVGVTATLSWTSTDADGDAITYSVYLGDSTPPPIVSASQTTTTFEPDSMEYSTKYYWKIEAQDSNGGKSSSPVWSFTTMDAPVPETVSKPSTPTGPATGDQFEVLAFYATGSTSNLGHTLEYMFDWGDARLSSWGNGDSIEVAYSVAGTYYVRARARCTTHNSALSDWSDSLSVTISAIPEAVSTPNAPNGPTNGLVSESLDYTLSGSTSNLSHGVEYRVSWGDNDTTAWSTTTNVSHTWSVAGSYDVTVQARCVSDTQVESAWSSATSVTISDPPTETVSTPSTPTGPATGETGTILYYTGYNTAVSSAGHSVSYRLAWGDGDTTNWVLNSTYGHAWAAAGTYDVKVQARCVSDTDVMSSWSAPKSVTITQTTETISTPTITGPASGTTSLNQTFRVTSSSTSTAGHPVEYVYDWGDGTTSVTTSTIRGHLFSVAGTYDVTVTGRCQSHPSVVSAVSNTVTITITTK